MLIEMLRPEELGMMDTWRRWYAWSNDGQSKNNNYAPMENILHEWDIRKSEYLSKIFGDQLRITKHLNYTKSYEELQEEISDMTQEHSHYGRARRNGHEFMRAWNDYLFRNRFTFNDEQDTGLRRIMSDDCLISNIYDGPSFRINTRDGKPFCINRGCKTSKALGKLADILELPGWEDFRICHSQILNQKTLGGNLTISIHPLDYMTMSDNAYGWESCMSWEQEGGYRQGTVEMMNSRSVIIAYLAGNENMRIGDDYWNSKKWRQLFVLDHNIIAGVKDYPYHNETLGLEVVKWLKELAAERLGWKYEDIIPYHFGDEKVYLNYLPDDVNGFVPDFTSLIMYSDFGCLDAHWMCFSSDINPDEISAKDKWGSAYLPIPYSGNSQCMICGEINPPFEDESCLACEDCQERQRCDCCGETVSEAWELDGMHLCESCWENCVHECANCGDEHFVDDMTAIHIIPRINETLRKELCENWLSHNRYVSCGFANTRADLEMAEYNFIRDTAPAAWVCSTKDCLSDWANKFLKSGEHPHLRAWRWDTKVCVYLDQLNDEGIYEFAWGFKDKNEEYIECFGSYHCQPTRFIELL